MSFDQPRHAAGAPTGGQFATTTRRESGVTLVQDVGRPLVEVLTEQLTARRQHLAHLETTALVLREQHLTAVEARRTPTTARQARDAGADAAELDFLRDTVDAELEVTGHDVDVLRARIDIAQDPQQVIEQVRRLRDVTGPDDLDRAAPLLAALDGECDAGRLPTHPWREGRRDELVADLTASLSTTPRHPAAPAWREQLAVLNDPMRARRLEVASRYGHDTATRLAKARQAQSAVRAHLDGQTPRTPQLRVV